MPGFAALGLNPTFPLEKTAAHRVVFALDQSLLPGLQRNGQHIAEGRLNCFFFKDDVTEPQRDARRI